MSEISTYILGDEVSGKFYIGSTGNLTRRIREHKLDLKKNIHDNFRLQELYNNNETRLKVYSIKKETVEEARELEDILLKKYADDPRLLNLATNSSGGCGIERHPDRENIILKIKNTRTHKWNILSDEEKERRISVLKKVTHTPEAITKRVLAFKKHRESLTPEQRKQSKETIEKRRKSLTGKKRTKEQRSRMSETRLGKKATPETRKRMSEAMLEYYKTAPKRVVSEAVREKLRQANLGKKFSAERRFKMKEIARRVQASRDPEDRKHSAEAKLKISLKHQGKKLSTEHREKLSEVKRNKFASKSKEEKEAFNKRLADARRASNLRKRQLALDL